MLHYCCDPNPIIQRKSVRPVKFPNLLGQSTAVYVIGVLLVLIIIVHGWNICIGERNTRYFMGFIIWHFLICIYGIIALALILAGRLKEQKVIHILTVYYGVEGSFRNLAPFVLLWLVNYNTQIMIMVFLGVISLLLAGFFTYHAKLCLTNTTTNESFKWEDHLSWQRKVRETKVSAAALKASLGELNQEKKAEEINWTTFFRRSRVEEVQHI